MGSERGMYFLKGQLGHGDKITRDRPTVVSELSRHKIIRAGSGRSHTVVVTNEGQSFSFGWNKHGQLGTGSVKNELPVCHNMVSLVMAPTMSWGFGGYGRLGHREQKDEWTPRRVDIFTRQNFLPPEAIVSAGSVNSSCTAGGGQLYMWGKIKNTGDDSMYPKPLMDLSGWHLRCMDSGNMHHFVGADYSCISWGHAQSGELGYGPNAQKSSAIPKKVEILEGMHVISVACGFAHSMVVVDRTDVGDKLDQLEVFDGKASEEVPENETPVPEKAPKKATKSATNSKKRKKAKDSSESEEEDDEEENSDYDSEEQPNGKPAGRGRGGSKGGNKSTRGKKGGTGRGRGRPPAATKSSASEKAKGGSGKRGRPKKSN
nr:protein RCC2 homolog [Ipomoea batatas]